MKLNKSPSMPSYRHSPSAFSKTLSKMSNSNSKSKLATQRTSMHQYESKIPANRDRAFDIKQKMVKAEMRKSVYEQTKKGIDNDNFINHMQYLRKNSKANIPR